MPRRKVVKQVPVGKKIKKARTSKKKKLDQLANETGFSIDYLKDIESGKAIPPVGALLQISRALEIDSGALLKEPEWNPSCKAASRPIPSERKITPTRP
jgi:transcriptional regulator with XRE-family HTH domain